MPARGEQDRRRVQAQTSAKDDRREDVALDLVHGRDDRLADRRRAGDRAPVTSACWKASMAACWYCASCCCVSSA
jgi:hypothetical protein